LLEGLGEVELLHAISQANLMLIIHLENFSLSYPKYQFFVNSVIDFYPLMNGQIILKF
jgi:hypothetical protein